MNGAHAAPAGGRGGEPDAATLLSDLTALRHRTRADRQGYAFPLFVFGGLILLAPLLYATNGEFEEGDVLVQVFQTNAGQDPASPTLIAWYWLATLVLGSLATAWWYRRRANHTGVETDARAFLVAAGAAFAGFLLGVHLLGEVASELYSAWQVNLPLILGSSTTAGLGTYWSTRPDRQAAQRTVGMFGSAIFAALAFAAIGVYAVSGFSALYVIAVGLLVLAWLERSVLLGVTGVLFTLTAIPVMMPVTVLDMHIAAQAVLYQLGLGAATRQVEVLQMLVLPAAILLIAGAVAALSRRRGA